MSVAVPAAITLGSSARAGGTLEERKLPMKFGWVACEPNCTGWVSAVGIVTSDSPRDFDEFARGRDLAGATVVLDSCGGSVNDDSSQSCKYCGGTNFSPYTSCGNSQPVPYCH